MTARSFDAKAEAQTLGELADRLGRREEYDRVDAVIAAALRRAYEAGASDMRDRAAAALEGRQPQTIEARLLTAEQLADERFTYRATRTHWQAAAEAVRALPTEAT